MDEHHSDDWSQTDPNGHSIGSIDDTLDGPTPNQGSLNNWTHLAQAHYDPTETRELTTVIIEAIAAIQAVPMTEIKDPPLYDVVDTSAVENALFGRPDSNRNGTDSAFEFRYNEYLVRITRDGWVTVYGQHGATGTGSE